MPDAAPLLDAVDRPMWRLFAYLRPMRGRVVFATVAASANKVLDLAPPVIVAWLTDVLFGRSPAWLAGWGAPFDQVVFLAVLTVVVFALESVCQWAYQYGFTTLAQDVQHALRQDAYARVQDRELRFFEEHRLGKTLAMLSDDVNQLERFLNGALVEIVHLAVLVVFAGVVLFAVSVPMAVVALIPVPVIVWGSLRFSRAMESRYQEVRGAVGDLAARLENNIAGIAVIKSFTAEAHEQGRVTAASDAYRHANHRAIVLSAVFVPLIRMAIALGFGGVIALGGWLVQEGTLTPGALVLFCMLTQRLLWPLTRLGTTFDEYQRAKVSAGRVFSLLATPSRVADPASPRALGRARGEVEFQAVDFAYSGGVGAVLDGLSFRLGAGEMVGIAGPTGAGKSTIIKLLLRFYDPSAGTVRIDGVDLREFAQADLRRQIALVSQDVYLFHGTIAENIAYGALASGGAPDPAEIVRVARLAELHDFVQSLPDGYDSIVGERGIKLSGGQRQRLSIARALLKDAPILVLDEATSSVDTETERAIQHNLAAITQGRTALVIAHRLSTIRHAHRILVVTAGRLAEVGTHDDLVVRGGAYADLWSVQSGSIAAEGAAR